MIHFKEHTHGVVFWIFQATLALLGLSMLAVYEYSKKENIFDIAMGEIFVFSALFTFLGSKVGGYLGAKMEEDPCGEMDMGVLSTMGAFLGATVCALAGTALTGLYFFIDASSIHIPIVVSILVLMYISARHEIRVKKRGPVAGACCPTPRKDKRWSMKNKLAVLLFFTLLIEVILTLLMIAVMRRDLANQWMLGGMMYGMSGAMIGGFLGGYLAGLLDEHAGEESCDNPIMVCGMSLMGGMMGGMLAGMIGGMNALMGAGTIVPTVVLPLLLVVGFYVWMYRGKFELELTPRKRRSTDLEEMACQKS